MVDEELISMVEELLSKYGLEKVIEALKEMLSEDVTDKYLK